MLKQTTKILIEGDSVINDKVAARFSAVIDTVDPKNMGISMRQIDKDICREYRAEVRADQDAFEDHAYSVQEKVLAATETN